MAIWASVILNGRLSFAAVEVVFPAGYGYALTVFVQGFEQVEDFRVLGEDGYDIRRLGRDVGVDYAEFQLPVAIIFAVTGVSRAVLVVTDIQGGYFDRLSLTPINRLAMLLGMMVADLALVIALTLPVLALGFAFGVWFESGPIGIVVFLLIAGLWGLVYTGFPYAIALKTGNPAAVNSSFLLFMPFVFLTTMFLPKEAMTGWMATIVTYNPVTYLLAALRSLISEGWDGAAIAQGLGAVLGVGIVSISLAMLALRGRVRKR